MTAAHAIAVHGLTHRYGDRKALDALDFHVEIGEVFGLLGPNGGGKTTLFGILSTLLPVQDGMVKILGYDVRSRQALVRSLIGVVFQSPSLDRKLTVEENLKHQGHLYALRGRGLKERIDDLLDRLGIADRRTDRVESLSGGLQRRVEVAKGLLHNPHVLLLDEPSTGLDPGARRDLWQYLHRLRDQSSVTVIVTTHLMEEADRCDRLGILHEGRLVALGTPDELRCTVEGDCITIRCRQPETLSSQIVDRFAVEPQIIAGNLLIHRRRGHELVQQLVDAFGEQVESISLGKPTLEDVFVQRTGHRFWEGDQP